MDVIKTGPGSDPHSAVNNARRALHMAKYQWKEANRGRYDKSKAATTLNRARARLRRILYGRADHHYPDLETSIAGIPCGIVVESYTPPKQWRQHTFPGAGPGDCDPPEPAECEWFVVDRNGYFAEWLQDKMDCHDRWRIEEELGV